MEKINYKDLQDYITILEKGKNLDEKFKYNKQKITDQEKIDNISISKNIDNDWLDKILNKSKF